MNAGKETFTTGQQLKKHEYTTVGSLDETQLVTDKRKTKYKTEQMWKFNTVKSVHCRGTNCCIKTNKMHATLFLIMHNERVKIYLQRTQLVFNITISTCGNILKMSR